jgi:hypothetical protein
MADVWGDAIPQAVPETAEQVYPFKNTLLAHYALDSQAPNWDVRKFHGYDFPSEGTPHESRDNKGAKFVAEVIDTTTVHDDGVPFLRVHKTFDDESWDTNVVVQMLQQFIWEVMFGGQEPLCWNDPADGTVKDSSIFHMQMAAYRVVSNTRRFGDPGPEGVHQDTAELTAIMLVRRENLQHDSGWNRVWKLEQPNGKVESELEGDTGSDNLLAHTLLASQFDMLLVLDRDVKHEALPIRADDQTLDAVRDVLTFEVRRPWVVAGKPPCT